MAGKTSKKMTAAERTVAEKKTESRKEANRAKNAARNQANLDYIKEHGLSSFSVEKTVMRPVKRGKDIEMVEKIISRPAAPGTIVARHRNSLDNTRHLAWLEAQKDSPLSPEHSTAQHIRAKAAAKREKSLQIVVPGA